MLSCKLPACAAGQPIMPVFRSARFVSSWSAFPGCRTAQPAAVRMAPNIAGLDEFDVRSALRKALEINAVLENDVNAALLGEHWAGENRGIDNLVYVKVGTGIGAGVLCNGAIVRGSGGAGGQISSMPIGADPDDPESLRRGALERAAAGDGIRARYRILSGQDADTEEIFERAASGNVAAATSLDDAARNIALALGATCAMIDPEKIILGGSIGSRKEIVERVARALERIHPDPAPVVAETPEFESALLGCAYLGLQHLSASLLGVVSHAGRDRLETRPPDEVRRREVSRNSAAVHAGGLGRTEAPPGSDVHDTSETPYPIPESNAERRFQMIAACPPGTSPTGFALP